MAIIESITLAAGIGKAALAFLDWLDGDSDAKAALGMLSVLEDSLANYLQVHPDPAGQAVLNAVRSSKDELHSSPEISDMVRKEVHALYRRFVDFAFSRAFRESSAEVARQAREGGGMRLPGALGMIVMILALSFPLAGCRLTRERVDRAAMPPVLTVQFPEGVTTQTLSVHEVGGRVWVASPIPAEE